MSQDNLIPFVTPETSATFSDALSDLVRTGAREIIGSRIWTQANTHTGMIFDVNCSDSWYGKDGNMLNRLR